MRVPFDRATVVPSTTAGELNVSHPPNVYLAPSGAPWSMMSVCPLRSSARSTWAPSE